MSSRQGHSRPARVPSRGQTEAQRRLTFTPEQALKFAVDKHRAGELDDAEMIYATLLERWPDHADLVSHMGVLQLQRGDLQRSIGLLRHAVKLAPEASGIWNNLGNVLLRLQDVDGAERAFCRSVELQDNPEAWSNLSRIHRRDKAWADSEAACRHALSIAPNFGDAWHNLSLALLGQGRVAEGVDAAVKAAVLLPAHERRRSSYARALVLAGEFEQAASVYREWLADEPDNPYVTHHLAACSGEGTPKPERASDAYVEQVFDGFAATFDAQLAKLQYRAPEFVAAALRSVLPEPARQFDIADLGCGTGLCGPLVRGWARRLQGCDLSSAMLDRARQLDVYDALDKEELVQFLNANPESFDIVLSADTLCYFGELSAVADAARRALRPGGWLVFTVEALPDDATVGHRLLANGRYAHGRDYLLSTFRAAGLSASPPIAQVLRNEAAKPVHGWVVSARRPV